MWYDAGMQKHIKRVAGGLSAICVLGVGLLMADIPKALEQADKSFLFMAKSFGYDEPPAHFITAAWSHPWVVFVVFLLMFLLGVGISWGIEALWNQLKRALAAKAQPSPARRGMQIRRSALDLTSGVNQARPDFSLQDLVARISPGFGDMPASRNERRNWERSINRAIADFVVENDLSVWARWRDLPRDGIDEATLKRAQFDHLNGRFSAFLPTDSERSVYTDVMFNTFEVERALNER
jgi:hypothetical protein